MNFNLFLQSLWALTDGIVLTVALTLPALLIGFCVSVPLAFMRASNNNCVSTPVLAYTYAFRGTPLIVQLFLTYYGLGQIELVRNSAAWVLLRDPFWCALLALSLNSAAYTTEIFRGGIRAVPRGMVEAAQAIGMSPMQQARRIIFPLAFRIVLPSYANEVISLLKASSLASTVTLLEITGLARKLVSETFAPYEVFLAAGTLYLMLTCLISTLFRRLELYLADSAPKEGKNALQLHPSVVAP